MRTIGSILHGAYGDYYWQSVSLKFLRMAHPDVRLRLFAASPSRHEVFSVFDYSFADSFTSWTDLASTPVDEILQYQVFDRDLQRDVLAKLPAHVLDKIDRRTNRIFWDDLRGKLPGDPADMMQLTPDGVRKLPGVMAAYGMDSQLFDRRPTVGFVWRYRVRSSAISPTGQPPKPVLIEKYSRVFRRLIEEFGCHILITCMGIETTDENLQRIDRKYESSQLDLPSDHCTYFQGMNWALDLELMSRCTVCAGHSSGFTEALFARRGGGVFLLDPPLHYVLVMLKRRIGLFDHNRLGGFLRLWNRPHTEARILSWLRGPLKRWRPAEPRIT